LGQAFQAKNIFSQQLVSFLESELRRLEGLDFRQVEGVHILASRYEAARTLGLAYQTMGRPHDAKLWFDYSKQIGLLTESLTSGGTRVTVPTLPTSGSAQAG
jgi:hypothetical protein